MGSPDRADQIADSLPDPLMQRIARKAFKNCGNCDNRIQCAYKLIDFGKACLFIYEGKIDQTLKPSMVAKAGAKVFMERCRKCTCLKTCIMFVISAVEKDHSQLTDLFHKRLTEVKDEEEMAILIENILKDQGLTTTKLIRKISVLWWECKEENKETNAVKAAKG